MSLTSRQRAFLDKLLDLYREARQPVHYSTVAEKLGVGNTTAYEMMKLLEDKGYVASDYVLAEGSGPGRSSVVFYPTFKALKTFRRLAGAAVKAEEWERVKERILSKVGKGEIKEKELLDEMLAKIPTSESPLVYCAEVITALLLNIKREIRSRLGEHRLIKNLMTPGPPGQRELGLLPGFALGLSFLENATRQWDKLVEYSQECQRSLQRLDNDMRRDLLEFLREMMVALQA
ncbi:MAG: helix-turn-helix domain-containing protein [Anaerolineae bacterium]